MKKTLLILFVLLGSVITATADDVVTVSNTDIPKGAKGSFSIDLTNTTTTFTGYEMVLTLPQGVTFSDAKLGDRYDNHSCQANNPYEEDNQKTKIVVSSASSALIAGTSGSLLTIEVNVADNVSVGELTGASLTGIKFSTGTLSTLSDVNFSLNITNGIALDEESTVLPASQTNVNVTVKRTLVGGKWNTMCLPFALTKELVDAAFGSDATICYLDKLTNKDSSYELSFEIDDLSLGINANAPFIVKPSSNKTELSFNGVNINANEDATLTVRGATFTGTLRAGKTIPVNSIFLGAGDNKFYYSDGTNTIKGFRGYFSITNFDPAASRQIKLMVDGEEATGIEGLYINGEAVAEGVYNLKGQRIDMPTQKGVYIKDGKKVVIK